MKPTQRIMRQSHRIDYFLLGMGFCLFLLMVMIVIFKVILK